MMPSLCLGFVWDSQYMINVIVIVALGTPKNVVNTPNTYAKCHMPNAMYCIPNTKYQGTGVRAETQSKVRLSTAQQINHTQRGACYVRASTAVNV